MMVQSVRILKILLLLAWCGVIAADENVACFKLPQTFSVEVTPINGDVHEKMKFNIHKKLKSLILKAN